MAKQQTFENNDCSALSTSQYMTGALIQVHLLLDQIEAAESMREGKPVPLKVWQRLLETARQTSVALGRE